MTGNSFKKVAQLFKTAGVAFVQHTSFFNIQKNVIAPSLKVVWSEHVDNMLKTLPGGAVLCGNGRCDSPGHSAKHLVYPLMEHGSGRIVHLEFVDKRQVIHARSLSLSLSLSCCHLHTIAICRLL